MFAESFRMRFDKGKSALTSWVGSFCSIFLTVIVLAYTYQKINVLIDKKDVDVLQTTKFQALTDDDTFSFTNGFNIAVAYTGFDSETEPFDDPTIGSVVFNHYKWG